MKLRIDDLLTIQNELDSRIFTMHHTSRTQTQRDRVLALLVELGECANETRCFKYWSVAKASPASVIAEELSDVIHFMFSLGIDLFGVNKPVEIAFDLIDASLNDLFLMAYQSAVKLLEDFNENHLLSLYQAVFSIANQLAIEPNQLRTEYLLKNKKNHERQDNNY